MQITLFILIAIAVLVSSQTTTTCNCDGDCNAISTTNPKVCCGSTTNTGVYGGVCYTPTTTTVNSCPTNSDHLTICNTSPTNTKPPQNVVEPSSPPYSHPVSPQTTTEPPSSTTKPPVNVVSPPYSHNVPPTTTEPPSSTTKPPQNVVEPSSPPYSHTVPTTHEKTPCKCDANCPSTTDTKSICCSTSEATAGYCYPQSSAANVYVCPSISSGILVHISHCETPTQQPTHTTIPPTYTPAPVVYEECHCDTDCLHAYDTTSIPWICCAKTNTVGSCVYKTTSLCSSQITVSGSISNTGSIRLETCGDLPTPPTHPTEQSPPTAPKGEVVSTGVIVPNTPPFSVTIVKPSVTVVVIVANKDALSDAFAAVDVTDVKAVEVTGTIDTTGTSSTITIKVDSVTSDASTIKSNVLKGLLYIFKETSSEDWTLVFVAGKRRGLLQNQGTVSATYSPQTYGIQESSVSRSVVSVAALVLGAVVSLF